VGHKIVLFNKIFNQNSFDEILTVSIYVDYRSKRFSVLGVDKQVLAKASGKAMCVRAKNWCDSSQKFLTRCADAGNLEACYFLGMVINNPNSLSLYLDMMPP
jgi:hypothetical protein